MPQVGGEIQVGFIGVRNYIDLPRGNLYTVGKMDYNKKTEE